MDHFQVAGWQLKGLPPAILGVAVAMIRYLNKETMIGKTKIQLLIFLVLTFSMLSVYPQDENNFEISKNIEIYVDIMRQLNLNYADNINPGNLSKTAIDAMLNDLDPYTVYIPESQLEDFDLMTRGEYGGMGALIQKQGDGVYITEPYEGFPAEKAGLIAGDQIIAIDNESAEGKSSSEISERLKGAPGTSFVITIKRYGDTTTRNIEVIREKVKIPNIPYYGILERNIGYIGLTQFNPNSANDIKKAFEEIRKDHPLNGLILDLRGNGGGLLNEAVDLCNIFVPKGQVIVTTKGKLTERIQTHKTRLNPIDTKIPLVVLVDNQSASASEIVAGALQDLDRGIVIGQKTYGKGLVQNVLELPYNSRLKVTVAKYYIPSGRCIQAIDYFARDSNEVAGKVPDSLITAFQTKGGRTVFDGGGVEPDIKLEPRQFSQITADLYANNYIFNFVNDFVLQHDSIASPSDFILADEVYNDFKQFVAEKEFSYKTETEALIERIKGSADREHYIDAIAPQLELLEENVKAEKKNDINKHKSEIEELLLVEIVTRYYFQKGKIEASLRNDPELKEAIKVLNDPGRTNQLLNAQVVGASKKQ